MLKDLATAYHQQLLDSPEGLAVFGEVGISPKGITEFGLGFIVEPQAESHEALIGSTVWPYRTVEDRVIQLRYDAEKFDVTGQWKHGVIGRDYPLDYPEVHLFNVGHALPGLRTNEVVVVQDVVSCVRLRQLGVRSVAVPGYQNFYDPWFELFREADVTLVFNDEGLEAGRAMMRKMRRHQIRHTAVSLPSWGTVSDVLDAGRDFDSIRMEYGLILTDSD